MQKPGKIVLMQIKAIGDTLMCEPALAALKAEFPASEITFITGSLAYPILRHHPAIDCFIVFKHNTSFWRYIVFLCKLLSRRWDVLIDFEKNPRTFTMAHFIRAKTKISFRSAYRNYIYNVLLANYDKGRYVAYEKLRLAQYLIPYSVTPTIPKVYIADASRSEAERIYSSLGYSKDDFVIAVSPVSKAQYRLWKPENFSRLCDYLYSKYHVKYLFTWGPGEKHIVDRVIAGMASHKPVTDYEIASLEILAALFERADMYLGCDNGPRHIAISSGIPSIGIFSHLYAQYWTPPDSDLHLYVAPKKVNPEIEVDGFDHVDYAEVQACCDRLLQRLLTARLSNQNSSDS